MSRRPLPLHETVTTFIDRHELLPAGPVVVAFSGGPDSLCLLHLLADLAPARGWRLVAAHLDHGLRLESAAEATLVADLAATRGVPLRAERVEVDKLAAATGLGREAAARRARYRFLAMVAAAEGGATVATGHTRDDQAETLLLRLARGTGLTGLRAMRPLTWLPAHAWAGPSTAPPLRLARPLLATDRAAIEAELAARGLAPLRDPSNAALTFTRNRLRHQLLPTWQALTPGIAARLAHTARLLADDEEVLAAESARAWAAVIRQVADDRALVLDRADFLAKPLALQRRLVRRAVAELGGGTPSRAAVEAALATVAAGGGRRAGLVGEIALVASGDFLHVGTPDALSRAWGPALPWMATGAILPLPLENRVTLPGGAWTLTSRTTPAAACQRPLSGCHAHFTPGMSALQPFLRTWQAGDRIALPNLGGRKKLSDLFIDRKLPRAARATTPVLVAGEAIAWVAGHAVGEPFRARADEPIVICCTLMPATPAREG